MISQNLDYLYDPLRIDPKLVEDYMYKANTTYQHVIQPINYEQMAMFLDMASYHYDIKKIDPYCIIKTGRRLKDLRLVSNIEEKSKFDHEYFIDPILRRYCLFPMDNCHIKVGLKVNLNRAVLTFLDLEMTPELISQMAYNYNRDFIDIRSVCMHDLSPIKVFNTSDMILEKDYLYAKNVSLMNSIKDPKRYLGDLKRHDRVRFKYGSISTWEKYYKNHWVINLGNKGYRGVRSRLEQHIWELHVLFYGHDPSRVVFLNELIMEDDGIYCTIFVPYTQREEDLYAFVRRVFAYRVTEDKQVIIAPNSMVPIFDRSLYYKGYL